MTIRYGADEVTRLASPSADYEAAGTTHPCLACGTDIKRIPGGRGPVWVHAATGLTFCTAKRQET